ncbi:MAG: 2-phospho-L-lactate guanylyltransferase [Methanobacteriaceae archaeon]|jgi:2-phospho-L-lactate guanylyltransferase|nr:2-phospho-L-lactate guanylyltransferase [Methanobacteriaceae archaeon]
MDNIYAIIPVSKFENAKTRLSPFLNEKEREKLLKAMLKDVTDSLRKYVDRIILISADKEVLNYGNKLKIDTLKESSNSNLNKAISQAMDYCKDKCKNVIITPSDIPLIMKIDIDLLIEKINSYEIIISPSKGGGTNILILAPKIIETEFGDFSYLKHIKKVEKNKLKYLVYDSFFIALDVNTTEDLGEIMVHGTGSQTRKYLKDLNIIVESIHGSERLKVRRDT